ncbi:quinone oxidoreductase family protein [Erythrobacter ani]|uniref:Quinone oxidoreductase n=1 Tax=Erythrobacter ani TaxID=2827235 RepID=A0ABS6SJL0_9SPHN|nr:quinone oxidoreductase [Erythrobacter ani]MBV7265198.1 quinone oxidoreductase [Erythrobacter ani]
MNVTRAQFTQFGGPEVIEWAEHEVPSPGPGEVLIEHTAIGLNFIDTYHRTGLYPVELPSGLGLEAAGTITALGEGVNDYSIGDRVAYMGPGLGAYATHRVMPADALFNVPDGVSDEVAAAAILKAATVEGLVERCADVNTGDTVVVHAAAGGVGLIMVQWLKAIGAHVIGTVSSAEKEAAAREAGCDHVIRYDHEDIAARVREITGGAGVPTVFDGVGKATFEASLDSMSPRGLQVSFGNASGPVDGVNLGILAQKGSLFVTRPTLFHYYATPDERAAGMARVWAMIESGKVHVTIGQTYPLAEAAQAHRDLEARKTTGSTVLIP